MNYWVRVIVFLLLNFGALAIGSIFTKAGVNSEWYASLLKAPWTPPGFLFGIAWTIIMICFSFFMAKIYGESVVNRRRKISLIYAVQWILNVAWNPIFFYLHKTQIALLDIFLLLIVVGYFLYLGINHVRLFWLLMLPYFSWLLIATSLNGYIVLNN
jgi:benzodiazapine receptor